MQRISLLVAAMVAACVIYAAVNAAPPSRACMWPMARSYAPCALSRSRSLAGLVDAQPAVTKHSAAIATKKACFVDTFCPPM